jgi:starvation-inducible DNA-binding protein
MNIGIPEKSREAVCEMLQVLLADEHVLYIKLRNYHWNIEARNFSELHEFYEEQYNDLAGVIDEVAERIRMLGFLSKGTMEDFLSITRLRESDYTTKATEQLEHLIHDHESIIRYLRDSIKEIEEKTDDIGTEGLLSELLEKHEGMRWMLNSFLPES